MGTDSLADCLRAIARDLTAGADPRQVVKHLNDLADEIEPGVAGDPEASPLALRIKDIRMGDVLSRAGADGSVGHYRVLRVLRKRNRVDVVDLDGRQSVRALWEFQSRWSKAQASSLHLPWRW